jgi:hypothetical protein
MAVPFFTYASFSLARGGIFLPIRLRDPEASFMARLAGTNRIGDSLSYLSDLDAPVSADAVMFVEAFVDNGPTVRVAITAGCHASTSGTVVRLCARQLTGEHGGAVHPGVTAEPVAGPADLAATPPQSALDPPRPAPWFGADASP